MGRLGRPLRQFGVLQDITELRQAEQELRASEVRFRTFVDHATDAFFLLDDDWTVLDVNRQACHESGLQQARTDRQTSKAISTSVSTMRPSSG